MITTHESKTLDWVMVMYICTFTWLTQHSLTHCEGLSVQSLTRVSEQWLCVGYHCNCLIMIGSELGRNRLLHVYFYMCTCQSLALALASVEEIVIQTIFSELNKRLLQ